MIHRSNYSLEFVSGILITLQIPISPDARVLAAHTIPREFADEDYVLEPSRFGNLNIPIMLLQGEKSPEHHRAATAAVHAALPGSRIVVIPGQQHIAMSTAPELFVQLVTKFLMEPD
mgnify:CR=1 FL=1